MQPFLHLILSFVRLILGDEAAQSIDQKIAQTLALLGDDTITIVPAFLRDGANTLRILSEGGLLIASWGNVAPDEIVAIGRFTGGVTSKNLPSILGLAMRGLTKKGKLVFLVRSRLTFFTKGEKGIELRVQSNALHQGDLVDQGDPIRWSMLVTDPMAVTNIRGIASESCFAGWTIVVQAEVYPFVVDGEHQVASNIQDKGAHDDRKNIITNVPMASWLYNVGSYRVWILPPGNSLEEDALDLEVEGLRSPSVPTIGPKITLKMKNRKSRAVPTTIVSLDDV
jgi:hypothetical protein